MNPQQIQTYETLKAVLKAKFIALSTYIKNLEKFHTSDLTVHLKTLVKKKQTYPRVVDDRK